MIKFCTVKCVNHLKPTEIKTLTDGFRYSPNSRFHIRCHAILLSNEGAFRQFQVTLWLKPCGPIDAAEILSTQQEAEYSGMYESATKSWIDKGIWPIYSPKYSPELNLIEILWRKVKYIWLPLDLYEPFDRLKESVNDILSKFGQEYKINFS
ncbi:transposase [Hahella sp. HN01]|nr:transposase [Hahella sp. HN01]MBU6955636.1 transposase [Hahella sp. HN01]